MSTIGPLAMVTLSLLAAPHQAPVGSGHTTSLLSAQPRAAFLKLIDRPRVPLNPSVQTLADSDGLIHEHILFSSEAGERVPTLLLKSPAPTGRRPVIIFLHGTGQSKDDLAGRLRALARHGFLAVAIDGRYHGERAGSVPGPSSTYVNAILRAFETGREHPFLYDAVWDVMRLVDYLDTRPDVDPRRIGLTGISKGGMETYLAAAVDERVAVAVPLIGVQSFRWGLDHSAWDSRAWTLRAAIDSAARESGEPVSAEFLRKFYDRVAPGLYGEFDGPAMLPLIAPRPLLVINGDSDGRTPVGGARECAAAAQRAYRALGAGDRFELFLQPDAGHQVTSVAADRLLAWFTRWLKPAE